MWCFLYHLFYIVHFFQRFSWRKSTIHNKKSIQTLIAGEHHFKESSDRSECRIFVNFSTVPTFSKLAQNGIHKNIKLVFPTGGFSDSFGVFWGKITIVTDWLRLRYELMKTRGFECSVTNSYWFQPTFQCVHIIVIYPACAKNKRHWTCFSSLTFNCLNVIYNIIHMNVLGVRRIWRRNVIFSSRVGSGAVAALFQVQIFYHINIWVVETCV